MANDKVQKTKNILRSAQEISRLKTKGHGSSQHLVRPAHLVKSSSKVRLQARRKVKIVLKDSSPVLHTVGL